MKKKFYYKKNGSLLEKLKKTESPNVTYLGEKFPIVMKKAKGLVVIDADGNRFKDFTSCFGVLALGHQHSVVVRTVRSQVGKLIHGMGDVHPSESKIKLLTTLQEIAPFPGSRTILGQSGSDAIEAALKTAMLVTKRNKFISFSGSYHGLTFGPLALSDRELFREGFETWLADKAMQLPFPSSDEFRENPLSCVDLPPDMRVINSQENQDNPDKVLTKLEELLRKRDVAALVLEPLQGRGGERVWPKDFVKNAYFLAKKYETLMIFDEIFSGLGRTGKMWAHEHFGVVPDILCAGKAMGGGFPLSACMSPLHDVWGKSSGEARHTSTFLGHPLSCEVGHQVLLAIRSHLPKFTLELEQIEKEYARFISVCKERAIDKQHPFVVRGIGFMRGLFFFASKPDFVPNLTTELLQAKYLLLPSGTHGNVLSLTPPLNTKAVEYRLLFNKLVNILAKV